MLVATAFAVSWCNLLDLNAREIFEQTRYYQGCVVDDPTIGWGRVALFSMLMLASATAHIVARVPTRGFIGVTTLMVVIGYTLWVGVVALISYAFGLSDDRFLNSPTAIPVVQGLGAVAVLSLRVRTPVRARLIASSLVIIVVPAGWLTVNYLVARSICS